MDVPSLCSPSHGDRLRRPQRILARWLRGPNEEYNKHDNQQDDHQRHRGVEVGLKTVEPSPDRIAKFVQGPVRQPPTEQDSQD